MYARARTSGRGNRRRTVCLSSGGVLAQEARGVGAGVSGDGGSEAKAPVITEFACDGDARDAGDVRDDDDGDGEGDGNAMVDVEEDAMVAMVCGVVVRVRRGVDAVVDGEGVGLVCGGGG